jgi:predicted alpha/beta hydrolase
MQIGTTFLLRLLLGLFLLYLTAFAMVYLQQDRFIFQRQILSGDFHFSHDATELTIPSTDSVRLNALLFKSVDHPSKGLILYFHGNRHSLERWGRYAPALTRNGYDVLMIDYRGYGKSNGIPSEQGLYRDAEAALAWAKQQYPSTPLIYYGRSLGTGVATYLATILYTSKTYIGDTI